MSVRVLVLRPRPRLVPVPSSSSRSSAVPSSPVRVGWDELRGLDLAVCDACAESFASSRSGEVDDWAETHGCDVELAALLALVTSRRAA
ncbi:hypothetical protein AB0C21_26055 [Spirillospora sp. NPDC049024]